MSEDRADIVAMARDWIGTPYVHQASMKGAGCDCLGLIRGLWRELFGAEPGKVPSYTQDWSEVAQEERLWAAARAHLLEKPISARMDGDIALFRMKDGAVAKHLGVLSIRDGVPTLIHAYSGHGVVENALVGPWSRRIVAVFAFPGRTN
jgi:NlpC/P60 family putative phage cell wall peptidase